MHDAIQFDRGIHELPMEETQPEAVPTDLIEQEKELARDQITAAWQLHVERVAEQLERGWHDEIRRVMEERLSAMKEKIDLEVDRRAALAVAGEIERARAAARLAMGERLNQTARRLDQADDGQGWASALLDGAGSFAARAILFSIIAGELNYEDHRSDEDLDANLLIQARVPIAQAPAFASVLETMDTVIAMAMPGEISAPLATVLGQGEDRRVYLLPIIVGQSESKRRVAAILYLEGDGQPLDLNVLEVIATLAGTTLDIRQAAQRGPAAVPAPAAKNLVTIGSPAQEPAQPLAPPDTAPMGREEQEAHAKAQRFARVRVAEMRLYQASAVRQGREDGNLYACLKGEMDRGRAQFKHEFMHVPSMIDYFHLELVRTLANDDESLLGAEYPGPLA
jgi:hypothetical protein